MIKTWAFVAPIVICALPAAPHAWAQAPRQSVTPEDDLQIAEVIVTARRRAESLQDVPVSVSALDANRILELQAENITGIQNAVPNLYIDRGDGANTVIYVRGIGQNDSLAFADPGVGVYMDDVFIARSQAAFLDLFDVERVEVLRGPQGTLYGRNTIGGAVKFVSAEPPEQFGFEVEAGGGNFDYQSLKARLGGRSAMICAAKLPLRPSGVTASRPTPSMARTTVIRSRSPGVERSRTRPATAPASP